ncbi:hypothetical protein BP5796_10532 [Coleophoma crateriformis]|uniref:Uncharacterized protein n=1 Tax=Coleophoma crateriformis TaxID=565419 RepID=A0A3D8QQV7_9HELO|nr:hypothetical protein BP5796_10532 [Coleophoma crateriformis]
MESSPLTLAHEHARAASIATHSSDTAVAINEHTLAAGEFANASSETGSAEALRTLRLLEAHHQRLSALLRYPSEHPVTPSSIEPEVQAASEKPISTSAAVAELRVSKPDFHPRSSSPLRYPPGLHSSRRLPPREPSSSIASNLATARGIRSNYTRQPLSPSVSNLQAPGNLDVPRKDGRRTSVASIPENSASKPSWVPPTQSNKAVAQTGTSRASAVAEHAPPAALVDDGFSKFYNVFETMLSKLSAPLAFAGLPLASGEPATPVPEADSSPLIRRSRPRGKERMDSDPDLTKYISRAALRASTREGQSANDSFYVVPTTGHTASYANILSFAEKEKRRLAASMHSENPELFSEPSFEDEFVDARETPMPPSPALSRQTTSNKGRSTNREVDHRVEELLVENQTLKECIDKISKRLHTFEMSAQRNGLALQESMRFRRADSPARDSGSPLSSADEALKRRVIELEEQVMSQHAENEKLAAQNEKSRAVIVKYREKWEKLKEGAKARRDGTSSAKEAKEVNDKVKDAGSR